MSDFQDKFIYHITHVDNIAEILNNGGLLSKNQISQNDVEYKNIAHQNIQDRRQETLVPCGAKGNLHDYIPFYFAPRSPMLYVINSGNVDGYSGGQDEVVYWVTKVSEIIENKLPFVFTDGHGTMALTEFYDQTSDLDQIDWDLMKSIFWNDTEEDPDRKRRRQAEFLIHQECPATSLLGIGVKSDKMLEQVQAIPEVTKLNLKVVIKPNWYF